MVFGEDEDGNPTPPLWEVGSLRAKAKRPRPGRTAWTVEISNEINDLPDEGSYGAEWVFVKEVAPPVAAPAGPPAPASPPTGPPPAAPAPAPPPAPPSVPPSAAPPAAPAGRLRREAAAVASASEDPMHDAKEGDTRSEHLKEVLKWADSVPITNPLAYPTRKERVQHIEAEAAALEEAAAALAALEEAASEEEEEEEKFYSPTCDREKAAAAELAEKARVARAQKTAVNPLLVMALSNDYISNDQY